MVGISCAGVFNSTDAGNTWTPQNLGLEAFFLPKSDIEVGHDPHSIKKGILLNQMYSGNRIIAAFTVPKTMASLGTTYQIRVEKPYMDSILLFLRLI